MIQKLLLILVFISFSVQQQTPNSCLLASTNQGGPNFVFDFIIGDHGCTFNSFLCKYLGYPIVVSYLKIGSSCSVTTYYCNDELCCNYDSNVITSNLVQSGFRCNYDESNVDKLQAVRAQDGRLLIFYYSYFSPPGLYAIYCQTNNCSNTTITKFPSQYLSTFSVTTQRNQPLVAAVYGDPFTFNGTSIQFISCTDVACSNYSSFSFPDINGIYSLSNFLVDSNLNPIIAYSTYTFSEFCPLSTPSYGIGLIRCNNNNCSSFSNLIALETFICSIAPPQPHLNLILDSDSNARVSVASYFRGINYTQCTCNLTSCNCNGIPFVPTSLISNAAIFQTGNSTFFLSIANGTTYYVYSCLDASCLNLAPGYIALTGPVNASSDSPYTKTVNVRGFPVTLAAFSITNLCNAEGSLNTTTTTGTSNSSTVGSSSTGTSSGAISTTGTSSGAISTGTSSGAISTTGTSSGATSSGVSTTGSEESSSGGIEVPAFMLAVMAVVLF